MERRHGTRSLSSCALMCALLAVCAQIVIPLPGVPLSMALFAVHLCALLLGPSRAAASMLAYLLLGVCGLPVFAGFASGPAALFGPTGGFLLSYPLCVLATGRLCGGAEASFARRTLAALSGLFVCSALGVLWFMFYSGTPMTPAALLWWLLYLPGDLIKIFLAVFLAKRLEKPLRLLGV